MTNRTRHQITDHPASPPVSPEWSADIDASIIHRLAPLRGNPDNDIDYKHRIHCYRLEPHPTRSGVIAVASDGYAMGVAYDRSGHCTAPMTIDLPPALVAACAEPSGPVIYDQDYGQITPALLPGWIRPGRVHLSAKIALVSTASKKRPGFLYRRIEGIERTETAAPKLYGDDYVPWRNIIPPDGAIRTGSTWGVDPNILAKFGRLTEGSGDGLHLYTPADPSGFAVIRHTHTPEFFGLIMGIRPSGPSPTIPTWATEVDTQ